MTKGTMKFQFVQSRVPPIDLIGLPVTGLLKIDQRDRDHLMIEIDKIDEFIQTLKSCKKWLTSP